MTAAFTPLRVALAWLVGTFALFLLVGDVGRVPDMFKLIGFVTATIAAFALGYWLRAKTWRHPEESPADGGDSARRWVVFSAIYCIVFGAAFLAAYGASSPTDVLDALRNPGEAYFFRLRDARLDDESFAIQMLTLGAALTTPLVPFTIVFWERLTPVVRLLALAGAVSYCSYWIFIGTQKGVGDFACYAAVALLARAAIRGRRMGRRAVAAIAALGLAFGAYMVFNQSDRLTSENTTAGIQPNPIASAMFGEDIGRGVTTTLFYPTHGYLGLAYNLDTPVEWTHFRGSSRAFDSYWTQYVDTTATPIFNDTLPAHTEQRTGWPALTYWTTIYPWLASDLSWPGAVAFMFLVGWWTARWWLEAVYLRSKIALLLVGQMAILIAYVPANNQLGITRPGLVAFLTLLGLYFLSRLNAAVGRRVNVRDSDRHAAVRLGRGHREREGLTV